MAQNRSSAVMQRRNAAPDALEDFPTPPWATRALCEFLLSQGFPLSLMKVWEPACNRGYMTNPLREYFKSVFASDVCDYGLEGQDAVCDFLIDWASDLPAVDMVITNPPFRLGMEFILRGLEVAEYVAVFVRSAFDEGGERYEKLFQHHPELYALPFVERVCLWRSVLLDPDVRVWYPAKIPAGSPDDKPQGELKKPSSATAYQWLVFKRGHTGLSTKCRIAPCRLDLTRPGDYPPVPEHLKPPKGLLL